MASSPSARIHSVRCSTRGLDPLRARQRVQRGLDRLDWSSLGLPAEAILLVRRLVLPIAPTAPLHPQPPPWTDQTRERLRDLARQAPRPAWEPVSASANAVRFECLRELLVTLGRDLVAGTADTHWWWRSSLISPDLHGFAHRLLAELETAPAVCSDLADHQCLAPLLAALDASQLTQLTQQVAAVHGVSLDWKELPDARPPAPPTDCWSSSGSNDFPAAARAAATAGPAVSTTSPGAAQVPLNAPWLAALPELNWPQLTREQQACGAMLVLWHRVPRLMRDAAFRKHLRDWVQSASAALPSQAEPVHGLIPPIRSLNPSVLPEDSVTQPQGWRPSTPTVRLHPRSEQPEALDGERAPASETPHAANPNSRNEPGKGTFKPMRRQVVEETALGGVFFLLNVALALGLYGDFSQPLAATCDLSPWEWLDLIARARFWSAQCETDPLWERLRQLADRPAGSLPGAGFTPPELWQMPDPWLQPFALTSGPDKCDRVAEGAVGRPPALGWWWSSGAGRSRLVHPANFLVHEVPDDHFSGDVAHRLPWSLEQTWRNWADPDSPLPRWHPPPSNWQPTTTLRGWVDSQLDYLAARLALALGVPAEEAWPLLGLARATLRDDGTILSVTFALAQHSIAIRCAGLDRDPGWIPAAGRDVRFLFE